MRTRALKLSAVILATLLCATSSAAERCYGLFIGNDIGPEALQKKGDLYGSPPCSILLFYDARTLPELKTLNAINEAGTTPVITVEPWNADTKEFMPISDEYVESLAGILREFGQPVTMRFAHEMNGNWYPWSGNPDRYKALYRDFYDRFTRSAPDANIQWLWSVNALDIPPSDQNRAISYYPGDEYVDAIGLDGYLNNPPWTLRLLLYLKEKLLRRGTFEYIFGDQLHKLSSLNKPFIIAETAIAGGDNFKPYSIQTFFDDLMHRYAYISSFIWFDVSKEADWRVASDIKSLDNFQNGVREWINYEKK